MGQKNACRLAGMGIFGRYDKSSRSVCGGQIEPDGLYKRNLRRLEIKRHILARQNTRRKAIGAYIDGDTIKSAEFKLARTYTKAELDALIDDIENVDF